MKCLGREKLFAYTHHLLEPREKSEIEAHVAGCAACRSALEEYRKLDVLLEEWKQPEPSALFDARVHQAIRESAALPSRSGLFGFDWSRWLAPAAILGLVIFASVAVLRLRHPGEVSRRQIVQPVSPQPATPPPTSVQAPIEPEPGAEELKLYQNLPVLENYDLLSDFDVLSELPKGAVKVEN